MKTEYVRNATSLTSARHGVGLHLMVCCEDDGGEILQGYWAVPTQETYLVYTMVGRIATHGCYLPWQVGASRCDQGDGPGDAEVTLAHPGGGGPSNHTHP